MYTILTGAIKFAVILFVFNISLASAECNTPGACTTMEQVHPFDVSPFTLPDEFKEEWADYRSSWSRITGFELSGLHWKQFVVVYVNKGREIYKKNYGEYVRFYVDEDDDEDAEFTLYEVGTTFIKENYLAQNGQVGQPLSLTIMTKREPGFDAEHNDWEYFQTSVNGQIILRGTYDDPTTNGVCADCHGNIAERDYIFSSFYSE